MRIDRLELSSFRGFAALDLALHEHMTVLIGLNGSGKSSVLRALSIAAGSWFLGLRDAPAVGIAPEDMRTVLRVDGGLASLEPSGTARVEAEGEVQGQRGRWARTRATMRGHTTTRDAAFVKQLGIAAQDALSAGEPVDLPVVAMYGTGRLWLRKRRSGGAPERFARASRTSAYRGALDVEQDPARLEAWLRWRTMAQVQDRARGFSVMRDQIQRSAHLGARNAGLAAAYTGLTTGHAGSAEDLDAVLQAAAAAVDGVAVLVYDLDLDRLMVGFDDQQWIPFDLLADGMRSLLALVMDLAWRCVRLNPHLGVAAPAEARGVVLIDEIDLHLHPTWQREVLGALRRTFPNLQFVVSTHSPIVVGTAEPAWMRVLSLDAQGQAKVVVPDGSRGWDTNRVLKHLMGTAARPPREHDLVEDVRRAVDAGDAAAARESLTTLESIVGTHDPEVVSLWYAVHDVVADAAD